MLPLVIGESFVFYSIISLSHHFQLLSLSARRREARGGVGEQGQTLVILTESGIF
jgi:hypothetical protein